MSNIPFAMKNEVRAEYTIENGYILSGYYVPEEVLVQILSFVDLKTLTFSNDFVFHDGFVALLIGIGLNYNEREQIFNKNKIRVRNKSLCRGVCKNWRDVVQALVLKYKAEEEGCIHFKDRPHISHKLNWVDYYWIINKKPFGKNLLKNHCGQDKLAGWFVLSSGGGGWVVENSPHGNESLPAVDSKGKPSPEFNGLSSFFATSYLSCSKKQVIELSSVGLTPNIMDHLQPPIEVSEWIACRFDCGCVYDLKVSLLDQKEATLACFDFRKDFSVVPQEVWQKVSHTFREYGPGVRYVLFHHGGKDSQIWAGHYGSKMSGGVVKVLAEIEQKHFSSSSSSSDDSNIDQFCCIRFDFM